MLRERMSNLRVAMFLEVGTTTGALTGAYLAGHVHARWLFMIFGLVLAFSRWRCFGIAIATRARCRPMRWPTHFGCTTATLINR